MKKQIIGILAVLLIGALIFAGHSEASESKKTIELKYSAFCNPSMAIGKILEQFADRVYKESDGRLKITLFFSQSLSKLQDNSKAVRSGIADMCEYNVGSSAGLEELSRVTQLPFMGHTSYEEANSVFLQLYQKFPEIQREWNGLKILTVRHHLGFHFNFTEKEVHLPEDMKGMKIISSPAYVNFLRSVGAAPVEVGFGDWYMSLERGLVKALPTHFVAVLDMGLMDLFKTHTIFGASGCSNAAEVILINQDVWNGLPSDLQQILEDAAKWRNETVITSDVEREKIAFQTAKEKNHKLIYLTPEELKVWKDSAKKTEHSKWLEDNASRGPSQVIYDETLKLIQSYAK
ncbi:MAG: TRAP transporter substrate-binding protein DctP [Deltaproteobacteria bacterium]|nr:TRAP transporter substrate-binding protein DctP [Deltaproteobacteria bacterium]